MKIERRAIIVRDQVESVFSAILWRLCEASGALGAALVDAEGETVDYAGNASPFDLRVAAAELRLVFATLESSAIVEWSRSQELVVRSRRHSFGVWSLGDGYALVLVLPHGAFHTSRRALAEAAFDLAQEAGFSPTGLSSGRRWFFVQVQTAADDFRRPVALWQAGGWRRLSILGRLSAELQPNETGYLATVPSGSELLLVREPLGKWFLTTL